MGIVLLVLFFLFLCVVVVVVVVVAAAATVVVVTTCFGLQKTAQTGTRTTTAFCFGDGGIIRSHNDGWPRGKCGLQTTTRRR